MASTLPYGSRKDAMLSREKVEGLIADGRKIVIVSGMVLKVDAWLKYHPGGDKAIMHMVGRDATDEVNALVPAYILYMFDFCLSIDLDCTPLKLGNKCAHFK